MAIALGHRNGLGYPAPIIGTPDGEAGVLENVRLSAVNYSFILLSMSCGGDRYICHLSFDDPNFCREICELLKHHYGWLIRNIGELDVP